MNEESTDVSITICLSQGEPDVTVNDTLTFLSLTEFAESPMLKKLSQKQRRLWESQLRTLILDLRMLDLKEKGSEE